MIVVVPLVFTLGDEYAGVPAGAPGGGRFHERAGTATAAAARAVARASSTAVTQAACSWVIRAGDCERSIGPVEGPAPLIADLASLRQVSEPAHRQ